MKKLVLTLLLVMCLGLFAACGGGGSGTVELSESTSDYTVTVEVPEGDTAGESDYYFSTEPEDQYDFSDMVLIGKNIKIAFDKTTHVFNTNIYYVEEHGEIADPTYEQYKEYTMENPYGMLHFDAVEEVESNGVEGLQTEGEFFASRVLNTGDMFDGIPIFIDMIPTEDATEDLATILDSEEVMAILDSITFTEVE